MRILAVLPGVGPEGGAEQSFAAVAPVLIRSGVHVHLAVLSDYQTLVPQLERDGVVIHDLSSRRSLWAQVRALGELIRSVRPDVVHATLWEATLPSQIASIRSEVPLLITWAVTPNTASDVLELAGSRWKRRAVEYVDMLLGRLSGANYHAVTQGVAKSVGSALHADTSRIHVGERGRDPSSFETYVDRTQVRAALGVIEGEQLVLAVGRQDPQKGYASLLEAFDELAATDPRVQLVIAGREGSASASLQSQLRSSSSKERVHFVGQREDIPELLVAADVVVCSSWREGAAGALIEAMAAGTPVVSVDLVGLVGVLRDGENARVVPRAALAAGISDVLDDPLLRDRLVAGGRRTFVDRFTIDRSSDRLAEIYAHLASRSGSSNNREMS